MELASRQGGGGEADWATTDWLGHDRHYDRGEPGAVSDVSGEVGEEGSSTSRESSISSSSLLASCLLDARLSPSPTGARCPQERLPPALSAALRSTCFWKRAMTLGCAPTLFAAGGEGALRDPVLDRVQPPTTVAGAGGGAGVAALGARAGFGKAVAGITFSCSTMLATGVELSLSQ
jgi:hypothetical protein